LTLSEQTSMCDPITLVLDGEGRCRLAPTLNDRIEVTLFINIERGQHLEAPNDAVRRPIQGVRLS
jgi:hypothetical protein